ncbi:GMC family oxidoreductase N-terminal domain-containing protein [Streptomyces chartreusis]|uniref:GMC family oxidoreductase N-terminal domain-containing protein n=1 Tax=Streptomyces chartreusis TaxID=1969 RepID=UPI00367499FF
MSTQTTDVLVVGSGFGGAIPAYYLAAGGARVTILERGPRLAAADFTHSMRLGTYNKIVDVIRGEGVTVVAGNCVGGGSVIYFAASLRAPGFVFERRGSLGRRLWPASLTRATLDPWYDRVEQALPVTRTDWPDVSYAGGVLAAACQRAGHTCNPVPVAVKPQTCTNCNWMLSGCRFNAKRSLLLNYLPAAEAHGAVIRPLHEVQTVGPSPTSGYRYAVTYTVLDPDDYTCTAQVEIIHARTVVLAAGAIGTPIILQRSALLLGGIPKAVGRYFSGNGDRVSVADINDTKARILLGLSRPDGTAYQGLPLGRPITAATYDYLNPNAPEYSRFSLQQIYFPPLTNLLAQTANATWFGIEKRSMRARWRSWLTLLAMTEDDNEGFFATPPPTGSFMRLAPGLGQGTMSYHPTPLTRQGWTKADTALRGILEKDGLAFVRPWAEDVAGTVTAHPLGSARIGDEPAASALTDTHELRGHPGLFITDGSAVPTSLTVNPSLTIAALAERATPAIASHTRNTGVPLQNGAPIPSV